MSSISESRPKRKIKLSGVVLGNIEMEVVPKLKTLIQGVDGLLEVDDVSVLKEHAKQLKNTHDEYRNWSLTASTNEYEKGGIAKSKEIDEDRSELYGEFKLSYRRLNNRIESLGRTPLSSVVDPSEYDDKFGTPSSVRDWLQNQPEDSNKTLVASELGNDNYGGNEQAYNINIRGNPDLGASSDVTVQGSVINLCPDSTTHGHVSQNVNSPGVNIGSCSENIINSSVVSSASIIMPNTCNNDVISQSVYSSSVNNVSSTEIVLSPVLDLSRSANVLGLNSISDSQASKSVNNSLMNLSNCQSSIGSNSTIVSRGVSDNSFYGSNMNSGINMAAIMSQSCAINYLATVPASIGNTSSYSHNTGNGGVVYNSIYGSIPSYGGPFPNSSHRQPYVYLPQNSPYVVNTPTASTMPGSSLQPPLQTPPLQNPVQNSTLQHPVQNSPSQYPVQNSPLQHTAQNSPLQRSVQNSPLQHPVQNLPSHYPAQNSPLQHPVQNSPLQHPVQNSSSQYPVQNLPLQHPVQNSPLQHSVQNPPLQLPVQNATYQPHLQTSPLQHPVQNSPFQPPLQTSSLQPPLQISSNPHYGVHLANPSISQVPNHASGNHGDIPRPPAQSDGVREFLRLEIMKGGGSMMKFDGSKPDQFWIWYEEFESNIIAAGLSAFPREVIIALRVHTELRPRDIVVSHIERGIGEDPAASLENIWKQLIKRYGSDDIVSNSLTKKLKDFKPIRHEDDAGATEQMEDLHTLCLRIERLARRCKSLEHYLSPEGMKLIWKKFPSSFVNRFRKIYDSIIERGRVVTFKDLTDFMDQYIRINSNPIFREDNMRGRAKTLRSATAQEGSSSSGKDYDDAEREVSPENRSKTLRSHTGTVQQRQIQSKSRSSPSQSSTTPNKGTCTLHPENSQHLLKDCSIFKSLNFKERREHASKHRLCFNCLGAHRAKFCKADVKCSKCERSHLTIMHDDEYYQRSSRETYSNKTNRSQPTYDKTKNAESNKLTATKNCCTSLAEDGSMVKICSKTVPVQVQASPDGPIVRCLAIIDEQSTHTFVDDQLIGLLGVPQSNIKANRYSLTTLERLNTVVDGSIVSGVRVKGAEYGKWIALPPTYTHPGLPDSRSEAAGPETVRQHSHIRKFAKYFPQVNPDHEVLLLIGANCGPAMFTRCYGTNYPYVHKTALGYALVGPTCLGAGTKSSTPRVFRTSAPRCEHFNVEPDLFKPSVRSETSMDPFIERSDDDLPGLSKDDQEFMHIVSSGVCVNPRGNLEIPLPFKSGSKPPENKLAVYHRSNNTLQRLKRNPDKLEKCQEIIDSYIKKGQVHQLSTKEADEAITYVPIFPVTNEKKGKVRIVFDSSAKFKGVSTNDCLFQGPDENNRLIGVLMRFRHNPIAFSADVEAMFHCFFIPEHQEKYQCFFWFKDNNANNEIVPFTASVHVFGNTSSPSVANFGLRHTTVIDETPRDSPARHLLQRNFYVDDALYSTIDVQSAIATLKEAKEILGKFNMRLHKIISSHSALLNAFPEEDIAKNVDLVNLSNSETQTALGICWKVDTDELYLNSNFRDVKFTKRGVLSAIGSLYDPLGFAAPVGLTGKLLQRSFLQSTNDLDWDTPLPEHFREEWDNWVSQMPDVPLLRVPRSYHPIKFDLQISELHVFCDASSESIGFVTYLRQVSTEGDVSISFVFGSSRVAPKAATSIPRLELCAALAATQSTQYVLSELDLDISSISYYSDSKVTLGYLRNRSKRFSRYVTSRVNGILSSSSVLDWNFIPTDANPGDIASRRHTPQQLLNSVWLVGPKFLHEREVILFEEATDHFELPEVIKETSTLSTAVTEVNDTFELLLRFPSWKKLIRIVSALYRFGSLARKRDLSVADSEAKARIFLIAQVQQKSFPSALQSLKKGTNISSDDKMSPLCPFLDQDGLMRVGGRLQKSVFSYDIKHPILLPRNHELTTSILSDVHSSVFHQGRLITQAALRRSGYHILNPRSAVSSFIHNCHACRLIRADTCSQMMAPLPRDRVERIAPFEVSGMDVFGHYYIHDGKSTRRTTATKKVWVLLFTCMYSRAVHLEVLTSMDTPTFMMAFRRFTAIRGKCRLIRSDHGSNFIGSINQIEEAIEEKELREGLRSRDCEWQLIPPKSPHCGGSWEKKVASVKKVMSACLQLLGTRFLSRNEFSTLVQESASIINQTPLSDMPSDPSEPFPVCPALLLNHRESPTNSSTQFSEADMLSYGKKRWRRVEFLSDQFFDGWKNEYIQQQSKRYKWQHPSRNFNVGDVVLIKEPTARNHWPLAVVSEVFPSEDGLVRKVKLRLKPTAKGKTQFRERAVHNLVMIVPNLSNSSPPASVMVDHEV